jgi:flagellar basal body-associated protein FliL
MGPSDLSPIAQAALKQAEPTSSDTYLVYMIVLFMIMFMLGGLAALYMWLKFQSQKSKEVKGSRPELSSQEIEEIKTNAQQSLMINIHENKLAEAEADIKKNAEAVARIAESVAHLVQIVEAQTNQMVQHDQLITKLAEISGKQNKIINQFHGDSK